MTFEPHDIVWTPEKSKRIWDFYGSRPQFRTAFFGYIAGPMVAKKFMAAVAPAPDARILDFSCGHGDVIAALLPKLTGAQELHGCDFSNTYVSRVNARFRAEQRFKGAILVERLPSPLPSQHYDVIYATEVIEHLNDEELDGLLQECKRLLKPGGRLFFTTPNDEDYEAAKMMCPDCGCVYHKWQHLRTWTVTNLRARMEAAGIKTRSVETIAWLNVLSKLKMLVTQSRIRPDGLIYIGETVS